ncbi:MAG: AI-2E family transporter [Acidobacteria bacterium]|nr:AI-2E family transporter [Acidobacteriota bacterium]
MTEILGGEPRQGRREWRLTGIIFFGILALAILWTAVLILRPFITAILLGAIIVTVTFPLYRRLRTRLKGRQNAAAVVMLIGIVLLLFLPLVIVGVLLVQQANTVIQSVQSGDAQQILSRLDLASRLGFLRSWIPGFDPATINPQRLLLPVLQQLPGWVARHGAAVVGGLAGMVLSFFLVLLSAYFFYVEGEAILEELAILSPLPARYDAEFGERFKDVIDATFRGQVMTSLAQGIATTIGLAIAGVPAPLFWGAIATLLSLLPMVGAAVIWAPAAVYLFVTASMGHRALWPAIFLTIWGLVVVSTIDNVVRPWVMKGKAQLPAIPLLFAVLGGLQAFGFVGLVIGPLVFSLLMSVIDIYKRSFRTARAKSPIA